MQDAGCRHEEAKPNLLEMKEIIGELLEFPSGLLKQFKGGNVGHGQLTCTLYRGKKKDLRSDLSLSQSIVSLSTQSSGLSIPHHFLHAAQLCATSLLSWREAAFGFLLSPIWRLQGDGTP